MGAPSTRPPGSIAHTYKQQERAHCLRLAHWPVVDATHPRAPAVMPRDEPQWCEWHMQVTHTHTHAHTNTHAKHGSGDLCLADFNHARWPLDDEWQAAPLSLPCPLLSPPSLPPVHLSFLRPAGICFRSYREGRCYLFLTKPWPRYLKLSQFSEHIFYRVFLFGCLENM